MNTGKPGRTLIPALGMSRTNTTIGMKQITISWKSVFMEIRSAGQFRSRPVARGSRIVDACTTDLDGNPISPCAVLKLAGIM